MGSAQAEGAPSRPARPAATHLGQLGLGEARLAHLGGLAHGDVALGQGALGERLRRHVLAGLAVGEIRLAGSREPKAVLLAPPTTSLAFWGTPA